MKKLGTKRELIGVVIVLLLAAVGFALFAWYTMRPTDTIGTIATLSFGLVLSALIGIVLILDTAATTRWRRFWVDLLFAALMLTLIDYFFLDTTAPWQMLVAGAGVALAIVALLAIRKSMSKLLKESDESGISLVKVNENSLKIFREFFVDIC